MLCSQYSTKRMNQLFMIEWEVYWRQWVLQVRLFFQLTALHDRVHLCRCNRLSSNLWSHSDTGTFVWQNVSAKAWKATKQGLPPQAMPKQMIVFSGLQFDQVSLHPLVSILSDWQENLKADKEKKYLTNHEAIKQKYKNAGKSQIIFLYFTNQLTGYPMPVLVYWNLAANTSDSPVTANETGLNFLQPGCWCLFNKGALLVSGFSPALLKTLMTGDLSTLKKLDPYDLVRQAIDDERYSIITVWQHGWFSFRIQIPALFGSSSRVVRCWLIHPFSWSAFWWHYKVGPIFQVLVWKGRGWTWTGPFKRIPSGSSWSSSFGGLCKTRPKIVIYSVHILQKVPLITNDGERCHCPIVAVRNPCEVPPCF